MTGDTVETALLEVRLGDDGVLRCKTLPDAQATEEGVTQTVAAIRQLTGGKKVPSMWDARGKGRASPGGQLRFIQEATGLFTAIGALVNEDTPIGNLPDLMDRLLFPFRVFKSEDEAVAWLRTFVDAEAGSIEP